MAIFIENKFPKYLGLDVKFYNKGGYLPSLSPQAIAWRDMIIANGGSIDNTILTIIDNNLIKPMISSGIFACLDKFHLYAGTGNQIASLINIITPTLYGAFRINTGNLQWLNTSGFRSTVSTSNLGGYLVFGYNPATAEKWSADRFNNGQFVMMLNPLNNTSSTNMMGTGTGASTRHSAIERGNTVGMRVWSNATTSVAQSFVTTGKVWCAAFRSGNNLTNIVNSNTLTGSVPPLANIPAGNVHELTVGGQNNLLAFDTSFHMASGHGNGNYDNQLLRTYLLNTFTALGI
jgi:hypothetical protein